jgi:hypothetical protein
LVVPQAAEFDMKRLLYIGVLFAMVSAIVRADGRPGTIQFSDGKTLAGALSLTPGKQLRVYITDTTAVSIALAEVKEMRFKVEKEEMRRGFYFPNPGQAAQAQTDDTYPVRYLSAEISLADGKTVAGHLMTTTLYVENDDGTKKIVLMAKMTGEDNAKIDDLVYPTDIRLEAGAAAGASQIDLTQAGFVPLHPPVIFAKPDLKLLPAAQVEGKPIWTVATDHPVSILFSVEAADGIHVAWPMEPVLAADPTVKQIVEAALVNMHDFFDTRNVLACSLEDEDVYTLVMLSRVGPTDSFKAGRIPWSLVAMRWKYDADAKKVVLLNRTNLVVGRAENNSPLPAVLKQPELLRDITAKANP